MLLVLPVAEAVFLAVVSEKVLAIKMTLFRPATLHNLRTYQLLIERLRALAARPV